MDKPAEYIHLCNQFEFNGNTQTQVFYRCGETIPTTILHMRWIVGVVECFWTAGCKFPKATDQAACEKYIGMKLFPM